MHVLGLLLGGLCGAGAASAQPVQRELAPFLSQRDRADLRAALAARTLSVRRTVPPPRGMVAPVPDLRPGQALCLGGGRALTARALVADWPLAGRAGEDRLEVAGADGQWRPAAVGYSDPGLGVAVLDVPGLGDCPGLPTDPGPGDGDVGLGVALYGVAPGVAGLAETGVRGPAGENPTTAWYLLAVGEAFPLGTPLFNGRGTWLTLVGLTDAAVPGRTYILPARAVRAALEDRFRWDPARP